MGSAIFMRREEWYTGNFVTTYMAMLTTPNTVISSQRICCLNGYPSSLPRTQLYDSTMKRKKMKESSFPV